MATNFPDISAVNPDTGALWSAGDTFEDPSSGLTYTWMPPTWKASGVGESTTPDDGTFVKVVGDNMTGDLTLGTDKITLDATAGTAYFDGTSTFGAAVSEITDVNSTEAGSLISAGGTQWQVFDLADGSNATNLYNVRSGTKTLVQAAKGSGALLIGGDVAGGNPNTLLASDGSATFLGNVGVGTQSPLSTLVVSNGGAEGIEFNASSTTDIFAYNRSNSVSMVLGLGGEQVTFNTVGLGRAEAARFDNSGRLLVGTDTARSNYFYSTIGRTPGFQYEGSGSNTALGVYRADGLASLYLANGSPSIGNNATIGGINFVGNDGSNLRSFAKIEADSEATAEAANVPGRLVFSTTAVGSANPTERMRIDSSGRMLMGTTSYIGDGGGGKVQLVQGAGSDSRTLSLKNSAANQQLHLGLLNSGTSYLTWGGYYDNGWKSDDSGNTLCVGVVQMASDSSGSTFTVRTTNTPANSPSDRFTIDAAGSIKAPGIYGQALSGTTRDVIIRNDGYLGYQSSTRASKANISSLTDINWLYELNPVEFNYRVDANDDKTYSDEYHPDKEYGLIAEEVELINPELCDYEVDEDGNKQLAGVHYRKLTSVLLKAVQQADARIESLETRVYNGPTLDVKDRLQTKTAALEAIKAAAEDANITTLADFKSAIAAALFNI